MVRLQILTANYFFPPKPFNSNLNLVSAKQQCVSLVKHFFQIGGYGLIADTLLRFFASSPSGNLNHAGVLPCRSEKSEVSNWNDLIRSYATKDSPREAIGVYLEMRSLGIRPDKLTFPILLKACAAISALNDGRKIQVDVVKHGLDCNVYVQNTMIHFYGSCRRIRDARRVFDEMSYRTVVSWNAVLSACVDNECLKESFGLFVKMMDSGFDPDETTMVILLSSCSELGNLSFGRWVHSQVIGNGMDVNCRLGTALVDMYGKCGAVYEASMVFHRMLERNVWTWSAMILGLAQHGFASDALELFPKMKQSSISPNYVTFLGILCACSHAGLVDGGYKFFHDMENVHGIEPMMIHYGAMVDILSRAGRLKEAYNFILKMPVEADPVVWRTLLSAFTIHGVNDNDQIGDKVRKRLLELEPKRSGNLVMVANMYAEVGMWDKAENVRRTMKKRGLKKMAGESCIEVGGSIHRFFSGEDDHPQLDSEDFLQLLYGLNLHMKSVKNL